MPESLDTTDDGDTATIGQLQDVLGKFFAEKLYGDKGWALGILGSIKQQS
jgi:transcription initiation factor TFIID subunit 6